MTTHLPGHATPEATKAYADHCWSENPALSPDCWRLLNDLTIGKVGFGAYRVDGHDDQVLALEVALTSGINLIDTASNYMDGASEQLIGRVLRNLAGEGRITRDAVVLVSKIGYLQGDMLAAYQENPPPDTVPYAPHLWHCIHPDFLQAQLAQSQERLGVDVVDVLLLHNPEYYLQWAAQEGVPLEEARETFYARCQAAFTFLEQACRDGKIQTYGVSSNTFGSAAEAVDFVDLARLATAADAAAQVAWGRKKRAQFRVIETALNLLEMDVVKTVNTQAHTFEGAEPVSTLELASRRHMAVLANRPLNAFLPNGQAFRLADAGVMMPDAILPLQLAEDRLAAALGGWPVIDGQSLPKLSDHVDELLAHMPTPVHADQALMGVERHTEWLLEALHAWQKDKELAASLAESYKAVVSAFGQWLKEAASHRHQEALQPLRKAITPQLPADWQTVPLQQVALNVVASTPGVTCVLNGMRRAVYVEDAIAVMERPDFADVGGILS